MSAGISIRGCGLLVRNSEKPGGFPRNLCEFLRKLRSFWRYNRSIAHDMALRLDAGAGRRPGDWRWIMLQKQNLVSRLAER